VIPFFEFIGSLFYKLLIIFFFPTYCRIMDSTDNDNVGSSSIVSTQNPSSTLPQKPKKCEQTSMVWEHFTKVENRDPEDPKSKCNYCNKLFSCHTKRLGTSSMLSHLKNSCKKYPSRFDKSDKTQSKLSFEVKKGEQMAVGEGSIENLVITKYNAATIKTAISKMIIVDELPFRFVDGEGFQEFMNTIEPRFKIQSRVTVMKDCVFLYMSEKEKLRAMLKFVLPLILGLQCRTLIICVSQPILLIIIGTYIKEL
jgi:hypothetical protein